MNWSRLVRAARGVPWTLWITIACALLIFHTWYFSLGALTFGDLKTFTPDSLKQDFPFAHLWLGNERLGFPMTTFYQFYVAFAWLFKAGASWALAERLLFFWFFPVLLVGGIYGLVHAITRDRLASGLASLVALLNVQILTLALGGHVSDTNATALVAWVLWGTLEFMRSGRRPWLVMTVLALALQSAYDLRWNPPTAGLAIALAVAWALRTRMTHSALRAAAVFGAAILAILCANLYWLLPKIVGSTVAPAPPNGNLDISWVLRGSVITWTDAFAGWNPYFMNGFERPPLLQMPGPPYALLIPLAAVAAALLVRRRAATFFLGMLVFFAFLGKGANEPFGDPYVWAFQHVPVFGAYRDPSKLAIYVGIASAVLIALGVAALHRSQRPWLAHASSLAVGSIAIWLGFHAFDPSIGGVVKPRVIPAHYAAINRFLADDRSYGRVLWLPEVPRWVSHTLVHPAVDGVDLGRSEFLNFTLGPLDGPDPTSFVAVPVFKDLLRWGAFRYVAVAQDAYDDATVSGGATSVVRLVDILRANPHLREVRRFGPVVVFETQETPAHAWTAQSATIARGDFAGLEGAALVPGALGWSPLVFDRDARAGTHFNRLYDLDRTGPPPLSGDGLPHGDPVFAPPVDAHAVQRYARIASADSVVHGPQFADSLIDADGPSPGAWTLAAVLGRSTTSVWPPVADRVPPSAQNEVAPGSVLGMLVQHRGSGALVVLDANGGPWFDQTSLDHAHRFQMSQELLMRNDLPVPAQVTITLAVSQGTIALWSGDHAIAQAPKGGVLRARWLVPSGRSTFHLRASGAASYHAVRIAAEARPGPSSPDLRTTRIAVPPTRLYDRIAVQVIGANIDPERGRVVPLYELRDRYNGRRFVLAGPTIGDGHDVYAPLDVRAWLQEDILSEPGDLVPLGINDAYDRLDLVGVDVVIAPTTSGAPLLAAVDRIVVLRGEKPGEPIVAQRTIAATSFSGERIVARQARPGASLLTLDFGERPGDRRSWTGAVAALSGVFGTEHAAIVSDDGRFLRGFTTYGQAFVHPWGAIAAISDGPQMALVRIPLGAAFQHGIFALDVSTDDPTMRIHFALGITINGHRSWLVDDATEIAPTKAARFARIRVDLAAALTRVDPVVRGKVDSAMLLFERVGDVHGPTALVRFSDARIENAGSAVPATIVLGDRRVLPGPVRATQERVRTTAGSGNVPLVVTFSGGTQPPARVSKLDLGAVDQRATLAIPARARWLIFSERFDPGWQLRDAAGHVVVRHMIGFGFVNAWFDPHGMQGTYTLEYMPDRLSPLGFMLGSGALLALLVWALVEVRRVRA